MLVEVFRGPLEIMEALRSCSVIRPHGNGLLRISQSVAERCQYPLVPAKVSARSKHGIGSTRIQQPFPYQNLPNSLMPTKARTGRAWLSEGASSSLSLVPAEAGSHQPRLSQGAASSFLSAVAAVSVSSQEPCQLFSAAAARSEFVWQPDGLSHWDDWRGFAPCCVCSA